MRGPERPPSNGVRTSRVRGLAAVTLADWERAAAEAERLNAAHQARQRREQLARLVFRGLETADRMQVVLCEHGRPWIGATTDRSAAKVLAEHPSGLVGIYTRAIDWHALLADLEEVGL